MEKVNKKKMKNNHSYDHDVKSRSKLQTSEYLIIKKTINTYVDLLALGYLIAFPVALCDPQFWHCNVKIYCPDHFSCISLIHFCDLSRTEWINAVGGFFLSFVFALCCTSLWKMSWEESEKILIFADIPHIDFDGL